MKRNITFLMVLLSVLFLLPSCRAILLFEECHPAKQSMSKWVGDCEEMRIELYIKDEEADLMIVDYGEKKIPYLVWWHQNYLTQMSINDVREASLGEYAHASVHQNRGFWDVELINKTRFVLTDGSKQAPDSRFEIPELMLPSEIVMTRVETGLSAADIPQIEQDETYGFCPAYRYGTQWVSDDNQISFFIMDGGSGKVTVASEPNVKYYLEFFELNEKAYLLKWEEDSLFYFSRYKFGASTEEWKCEYFEDHFVAEVIHSELYEEGHILTFNLVETSQAPGSDK